MSPPTPRVVAFLPPVVQSLSFDLRPNTTHKFITIQGENFGPSLVPGSQCTADGGVVVAVNGEACAVVTMIVVRTRVG